MSFVPEVGFVPACSFEFMITSRDQLLSVAVLTGRTRWVWVVHLLETIEAFLTANTLKFVDRHC